jgi:hypothetical protein
MTKHEQTGLQKTVEERSMGGAALRKALMLVGREFHGLHVSAPYAFQPFTECEHPICKEASNALAATEETTLVGPRYRIGPCTCCSPGSGNVEIFCGDRPTHWSTSDKALVESVCELLNIELVARREPGPGAEIEKLKLELKDAYQMVGAADRMIDRLKNQIAETERSAGPGDRAMAGARLEELIRMVDSSRAEAQHEHDAAVSSNRPFAAATELGRKNALVGVLVMLRAAAIERSQTPQGARKRG